MNVMDSNRRKCSDVVAEFVWMTGLSGVKTKVSERAWLKGSCRDHGSVSVARP